MTDTIDQLPAALPEGKSGARIAAVMFSDVAGFSKLSDVHVEHFVRGFLPIIGTLARTSAQCPTYKNTWGDALYFQFHSVNEAGLFALEMHDLMRDLDWGTIDLPPLAVRSGLHAGPLFPFRDPITGQHCLWGRHVTRAARIEPVTPPGEVYASQEFAALAAAQRVKGFDCEPVGRVSLAKAYDPTARLYHVRRRGALRATTLLAPARQDAD